MTLSRENRIAFHLFHATMKEKYLNNFTQLEIHFTKLVIFITLLQIHFTHFLKYPIRSLNYVGQSFIRSAICLKLREFE